MKYCNHVALKLGVALELLLQLGNHKPHHSDFVLYARQIKGLVNCIITECLFGSEKGTSIVVRVAKLLRLSIYEFYTWLHSSC